MKRAVQWTAIVAFAVFVRNIHYFAGDRLWRELTTPYHAARVVARPPEQAIGMPVQGVRVSQIANTWHAPRAPRRLHEGQDIFARRGTPVRSATDGLVLKVGDNRLGGHAVWVLGAGGRTYYYADLDHWTTALAAGQLIQRGNVLGYVGNTGNARGTPPHLHFGVYGPGGAMNPLPLLARGEAAERQAGTAVATHPRADTGAAD